MNTGDFFYIGGNLLGGALCLYFFLWVLDFRPNLLNRHKCLKWGATFLFIALVGNVFFVPATSRLFWYLDYGLYILAVNSHTSYSLIGFVGIFLGFIGLHSAFFNEAR
jgi:hypothetical protein